MNNYIINFDYLKKIQQHLPYTGDYPQFSNLQIFTITTTQLTPLEYLIYNLTSIYFQLTSIEMHK